MPSVTTWSRLEPRSRDDSMRRTLGAQVHDALWFLTRQWQFGEFQGRDAGTPIGARLRGKMGEITAYHPGPLPVADPATVHPFDASKPLETVVEREWVR